MQAKFQSTTKPKRHRLALLVACLALFTSLLGGIASSASALDFGLAAAGSQAGTDFEMEAVGRSGAKYWRFGLDCFAWYGHESTIWQTWDHNFELAWEHGITVLPTLSSRCTTGSIELPSRSEWEPAGSSWEKFAKAVVEHYGINGSFWNGKSNPKPVENWEIQNEPNLAERGVSGVASGWIYAEFFKRIAETLQTAQGSFFPTHSLVGGLYYGDLAKDGASKTPHTFMQEMNTMYPAVKPWVYGVAIHPYEFGTTSISDIEADINEARSDVNTNLGFNKPLWITEIGWPVEGHNTGVHEDSLEWQEKDLNSIFNWVKQEASGKNIQALIFYMYRDDALGNGSWAHFCGLRSAEDPSQKWTQSSFRPAWYAFQQQTGAAKWPVPPLAETQAATSIGATEATLNGTVNPHGLPTSYHFEYGPSNSYVAWSPSSNTEVGWKEGTVTKSVTLTGLHPNTIYHYRIVATNENHEVLEAQDRTFKTTALTSGTKFGTPTSWGSWTSGYPLEYADVNGDGKADTLGRDSSGNVDVAWSNGASFLYATNWIHWSPTYSVDFADVNGDGKADILGRNSSGDIQVGWSNGATGFYTPTSWGSWSTAYSIDFADVNGDGKADAVGRNSAGDVQVGWSNGANAFLPSTSWTTWSTAYSLEFADVNGDKRADVIGKNAAGDVEVGLSTGGSFAGSTSWATWPSGYSLDFADVNGDGKADAVGKNSSGDIKVGLSTGSGFGSISSWGAWPSGAAIDFADVNGDGKADAVGRGGAGDVQVGISTGGKFNASTAWTSAYALELPDVNGDGKADAVGRNSSSDVQVSWSSGTGLLASTTWGGWNTAYSVDFADVNGDGKADILGRSSSGDIQVGWSNGATAFLPSSSWGSWSTVYSVDFADVNGDGKADAVGKNSSGDIQVGWSNGANAFLPSTSWGTWPSGYSLELADVNGDGKADVVGMNSVGTVKVSLSTGGSFAAAATWATWPSGYSIDFADVNGDGKTDALGKNSVGDVKAGLSTGSAFGATTSWATWPSGYSIDFADVNNDGKADAVGRNSAGDVKVGLAAE